MIKTFFFIHGVASMTKEMYEPHNKNYALARGKKCQSRKKYQLTELKKHKNEHESHLMKSQSEIYFHNDDIDENQEHNVEWQK